MKVKIIEGCNYLSQEARNRGLRYLEEEINEFLKDNPDIKIYHINQSSASHGDGEDFGIKTITTIWYS